MNEYTKIIEKLKEEIEDLKDENREAYNKFSSACVVANNLEKAIEKSECKIEKKQQMVSQLKQEKPSLLKKIYVQLFGKNLKRDDKQFEIIESLENDIALCMLTIENDKKLLNVLREEEKKLERQHVTTSNKNHSLIREKEQSLTFAEKCKEEAISRIMDTLLEQQTEDSSLQKLKKQMGIETSKEYIIEKKGTGYNK